MTQPSTKRLTTEAALNRRFYDITNSGAVADGTTDNTTVINAVITAANAAGGGAVFVPAASLAWATGSAIVMASNVTLIVEGTIKALASHTGAGITATNVSNIAIIGSGTIDMNTAATTNGGSANGQQGIYVSANVAITVDGVNIQDVTVKNCWQRGIQVETVTTGSNVTDVTIRGVTVNTCTNDDGIYVGGLGNSDSTTPSTSRLIWVERNTIINPGKDGITVTGVSDVSIDRNNITATNTPTFHGICVGLGVGGVSTDHCTDVTVSRNKVRGFTTASRFGINFSARCTRFAIDSNVCTGNRGGIAVDLTDPNATTNIILGDGTVTGNSCYNNTGSTASHGIYTNHASNLAITGNACRANAGSGILLGQCASCTVTGNVTISNAVAGIYLAGTTPVTVGGHVVAGNKSVSNTTNQYLTDAAPVASTQGSTATFVTV